MKLNPQSSSIEQLKQITHRLAKANERQETSCQATIHNSQKAKKEAINACKLLHRFSYKILFEIF